MAVRDRVSSLCVDCGDGPADGGRGGGEESRTSGGLIAPEPIVAPEPTVVLGLSELSNVESMPVGIPLALPQISSIISNTRSETCT
jgi:hypothetical protein